MKFRILGTLEAEAGGERLQLGGLCEQKLLAMLLIDATRTIPVNCLVDALWDHEPPGTAVKQVRNAVSRLRRLLADGGLPGVIVTDGTGYRIAVTEEALDSRLFDTEVRRAEVAVSAGQVEEGARLLRSALDLWRGPALAGLPGRVFEAAATAWNERRCAVAETYYDCQISLGRHREVLAELSALAADYPLRGKPVGQLMLALYRCGRQADALALYSKTRTLLAEETGLDPDPELQRLHQRILTSSSALAVPSPVTSEDHTAVTQIPPAVPRQLPGAVRHFTGRTGELKALSGLLDQAAEAGEAGPVVISAINGTAGIGKTALAVHWAHQIARQFPDGQLYVNLRGFDPSGSPVTPMEAVRGFLDAFRIAPERIPAGLEAQAGIYRSLLADKRVLIVLDNVRDAGQIRPLLPGSPGCLVIVTSRSQLTGLVAAEGACPITLSLLTKQEAHDLLARRLGSERIATEPEAAGELIDLCVRLPLALVIAAARASNQPGLPLAALVNELKSARSRLDALDTGDSATDVRTVLSWSYQNLSPAAARIFRLLGVHPGPDISPPAAASLAGIPLDQAREALEELIRAHLLAQPTPARFAFHDLLRAYAAEQASSHDDEAARRAAMHRVLDHYLQTGHSGAMLLNPARAPLSLPTSQCGVLPENLADGGQALAWFNAEHAVLIAATTQAAASGFDTYAWQLPSAAADFFSRRGQWNDLAATQQTALVAAGRLGDRAGQAYAHRALAHAHSQLGSPADARAHLRYAVGLYRRLGDRIGQAHVHHDLGMLSEQQGQYGDALDHAQQALDLVQAVGHKSAQARALNSVGWCHALLGNYEQALTHCQQALDLHRELGYRHGEADAWDSLGYAHQHLGHHSEAIACYTRALDLHRELGDRYYEAVVRTHQGDAQQAAGNLQGARHAWQQALAILDDLRHPDAARVRAQLGQPPTVPAGLARQDAILLS